MGGAPKDPIAGLEAILARSAARAPAPVESWDPPYCGDIGLRIGSDGTWFYQDSPIGRMELVRLFARVLRRDADGRTYVVTPAEKVLVTVDDAPFVAVALEALGAGRGQTLVLRTNVDDTVVCGPEHPLRFVPAPPEGGLKPYVRVRGRLEALLRRALYFELVALALTERQDGRDALGVWSGGAFFPMAADPS